MTIGIRLVPGTSRNWDSNRTEDLEMISVWILIGFIVLIVGYLAVVIFLPGWSVPKQALARIGKERGTIPENRETVEYKAGGEIIRSWLYLPKSTPGPVPGILLCNGFGGTKDVILEQYALRFAEVGFAVLALEYRHYGESDGSPRNVFSFRKQEEDIMCSVEYLRSRADIDSDRLFLWGTSAGGAYGINLAAEDHRIVGVIAQCPGLDHKKDSDIVMKREGFGYLLKLIVHAQRDKGRSRFGLSPHTLPLVGRPGTMAMLNAPGAFEGYSSLISPSSNFMNELCARVMLMPHGGNPIEKSKEVHCPVLICICEKDSLVAPGSHEKVAENLGKKARIRSYPIDHFDIYHGEWFERAVKEQIEFLIEIMEKS